MEQTQQLEYVEGKKPSIFKRVLLVLLVTVLLFGGAVYGAGYILLKGPSAYAGCQFIAYAQEHPPMNMVLKLYLSDEEVRAALSAEEEGGMFSVDLRAE